jgi:hypothetical protein
MSDWSEGIATSVRADGIREACLAYNAFHQSRPPRICFSVDLKRQPSSLQRMRIKPIAGLLVLALMMVSWPARAADPDDEYLQIFNLIQQADDLDTGGKADLAKAKYQQAQRALVGFKKNYPDWNTRLVSTRLTYLAEKLAPPPVKPSTDAAAGSGTNAPAAPSGAGATAQAPSKQVKLLEAGAEPRKVLRLHPTSDDKQTLILTVKSTKADLKVTLDATVKQVAGDGTITYALVLSDLDPGAKPGVPAEAAEAMKGVLNSLKGVSGTGTVSSQGICAAIKVQSGSGSNPFAGLIMDQLRDLLRQLVVPLPEEAVGPGAKWEVKGPIKSQDLTIDNTSTCELVSLEGERAVIEDTTVQSASNQKIQNPLVPGMKTDLTRMTAKGTSKRTVDLAHVLPIIGSAKYHKETVGTISMGGQKQSVNSKEDVDLHFEAK